MVLSDHVEHEPVGKARAMDSSDVPGCLSCDLAAGRRPLPGGMIHEGEHWYVDHCVGPLGVGTLVVVPKRHTTRVSELSEAEAAELGPLLRRAATVVDELLSPEQVYTCLWSHAGRQPVHIHYVVQPVTSTLMARHDAFGPRLQVAMFDRGEPPPTGEVEAFAERARHVFARLTRASGRHGDAGRAASAPSPRSSTSKPARVQRVGRSRP